MAHYNNNTSMLPSASTSSAVLINNVDDYLAPSQACVNPLYTGSSLSQEATNDKNSLPTGEATAPIIVPRVRRPRRRPVPVVDGDSSSLLSAPIIPSAAPAVKQQDPVKASITDCLACSGCVTTAETVLLELHHSLEALRRVLDSDDKTIVATISPATWADLLRHLKIDAEHCEVYQRKLVTCLRRVLKVSFVLDGNLPLQWSLLASAEEFCRAYRQAQTGKTSAIHNHNHNIAQELDEKQTPSMALSATKTQYWLPNGSTQIVLNDNQETAQQLPILTSSCPALVCLVEKSTHAAVEHLSRVKSPMSMAGAWWSATAGSSNPIVNHERYSLFHLAIMPCHDKKLEASRKDFVQGEDGTANKKADVDLVITTQEWFQMILEHIQKEEQDSGMTDRNFVTSEQERDDAVQNVRSYVESLPAADIVLQSRLSLDWTTGSMSISREGATLLMPDGGFQRNEKEDAMDLEEGAAMDMDAEDGTDMAGSSLAMSGHSTSIKSGSHGQKENSFFPFGSGGLADFVFCYAALHLFQCHISEVPWKPVQDNCQQEQQHAVVSARMQRRSVAARRDYYEAILYRHESDGTYSCDPRGNDVSTPVLRFATAYGLQTVQRALQPFSDQNNNAATTSSSLNYQYDFVEVMACPSGCLNGGGQLRMADRETPTVTRQRVADTQRHFTTLPSPLMLDMIQSSNQSLPSHTQLLHTQFHVVPPLAHALGAAAGVAVKDTLW